jgi:hypothetical protein
MLNADILTEMVRKYVRQDNSPLPKVSYVVDVGLNVSPVPEKIVCSGLLGGNSLDVFIEQFNIVEKELNTSNINKICLDHLVAFEEVLLTRLIDDKKLNIIPINKVLTYKCEYYIHFQGDKKFRKKLYKENNINNKTKKFFYEKDGTIVLSK